MSWDFGSPSEPESLWHGELYAWRRQGVRGSCLYHRQRQSSGGHVHTGLLLWDFWNCVLVNAFFNILGQVEMPVGVEEGPLSAHFLASFACVLWHRAWLRSTSFALGHVRWRSGILLCQTQAKLGGGDCLIEMACFARQLTQLGNCTLCQTNLANRNMFWFKCHLSFGFWVWECNAFELS